MQHTTNSILMQKQSTYWQRISWAEGVLLSVYFDERTRNTIKAQKCWAKASELAGRVHDRMTMSKREWEDSRDY